MGHCSGNDLIRGAVAGLIGGLVATYPLTLMRRWVAEGWGGGAERVRGGHFVDHDDRTRLPGRDGAARGEAPGQTSTMKVAVAVSRRVVGHEPGTGEREALGTAAHYAFGAGAGATYGVLAEVAPRVTAGAGTAFGAALCIAANETALPALGLAKPPTRAPRHTLAGDLAGHIVYGLATELVRRTVRRVL